MEKLKVSVIVPIYGVEKYLRQCLDSICGQTYQNLEIVLIDDQSPDECGTIADGYAACDPRIRVLHIKNRGAAGARNQGLSVCSGDYIVFVDSDDWIEADMIERMMREAEETQADIVQCQYYDEYKGYNKKHVCIEEARNFTGETFLKDLVHRWEDVLIWNKVISRKCIETIRFVEGRCIDDEFFTYKVVMNADRVRFCTDYLYHYRIRVSSAMLSQKNRKQRMIDQVDFVTIRYQEVCRRLPHLRELFLDHLCEVYLYVMSCAKQTDADAYQYAKKHLKKVFGSAMVSSIPLHRKKSICKYLLGGVPLQKAEGKQAQDAYE